MLGCCQLNRLRSSCRGTIRPEVVQIIRLLHHVRTSEPIVFYQLLIQMLSDFPNNAFRIFALRLRCDILFVHTSQLIPCFRIIEFWYHVLEFFGYSILTIFTCLTELNLCMSLAYQIGSILHLLPPSWTDSQMKNASHKNWKRFCRMKTYKQVTCSLTLRWTLRPFPALFLIDEGLLQGSALLATHVCKVSHIVEPVYSGYIQHSRPSCFSMK